MESVLIFDIDGTILDTAQKNIFPLIRVVKEETGKEMTYDELAFITALPGKEALRQLGFEDIERVYAKWVAYVNEYEEAPKPFGDMINVISELKANGAVCGIVSSKSRAQYEIDFVPTGLVEHITAAVLEDDTENHKPHPEPLLHILDLLKAKAEEALYIGDALSDLQSAKQAGIKFGLALWGSGTATGFEEADYVFRSPEEILDMHTRSKIDRIQIP